LPFECNLQRYSAVRGLINNNTRDLGQTAQPVLGFAGYVNSPREFSREPEYIPSLETSAEVGRCTLWLLYFPHLLLA
jgi:hypothetical protein